jgi:hypothetical protein
MAKEAGQDKSNHELRQKIAHSRDRLARDLSGLRYEMDFPLKFRKSFQRNTSVWAGAVAVVGVLLSLIPARTKKIYLGGKKKDEAPKKFLAAGFLLGAAKLAGSLLKPVVLRYVTKAVSGSISASARTKRTW